MKNLQLTDKYTLWGLSKEEYVEVCGYIDQMINFLSTPDGERTNELIVMIKQLQDLFKGMYGFGLDSIIGDTEVTSGTKPIPTKVAEKIVEHYTIGDITVYKCFAKRDWKLLRPGFDVNVHEDVHSSINCALAILHHPFAVIITTTSEN